MSSDQSVSYNCPLISVSYNCPLISVSYNCPLIRVFPINVPWLVFHINIPWLVFHINVPSLECFIQLEHRFYWIGNVCVKNEYRCIQQHQFMYNWLRVMRIMSFTVVWNMSSDASCLAEVQLTCLERTPEYLRESVPMWQVSLHHRFYNMGKIGHCSEKVSTVHRVSPHRSVPWRQVSLYVYKMQPPKKI